MGTEKTFIEPPRSRQNQGEDHHGSYFAGGRMAQIPGAPHQHLPEYCWRRGLKCVLPAKPVTAPTSSPVKKGSKVLRELSEIYQRESCGGCVIVGDENYGEGSSREHAAMSPRFLGAKGCDYPVFCKDTRSQSQKTGNFTAHVFQNPSDYD